MERTDPADLSRQFELKLVAEKAKRGYTDLNSAQTAIGWTGLFQFLPDDLKRKDDTGEKKKDERGQAQEAAHGGLGVECGLHALNGITVSCRRRGLYPRNCPRTRRFESVLRC